MRLLATLLVSLSLAACSSDAPTPAVPAGPDNAAAAASDPARPDALPDGAAPDDQPPAATPTDTAALSDDPTPDPSGVTPGGPMDGFGLIYGSQVPRGAYGDCFVYAASDAEDVVVWTGGGTTTSERRPRISGEAMESCPEPTGAPRDYAEHEGLRFSGRLASGGLLFTAATQVGSPITIVDERSGAALYDAPVYDGEIDITVTADGTIVFDRYAGQGEFEPAICGNAEDIDTSIVYERVVTALDGYAETVGEKRCAG